MPATDYIASTANLLKVFTDRLTSQQGTWTVQLFGGSSYDELFATLPELDALTSPLAVVVYSGSSYSNDPRRLARVSVLVIAENVGDVETGKTTARTMVDSALAALDEYISGDVYIRAVADNAVDLGIGIAAYLVEFEAKDH